MDSYPMLTKEEMCQWVLENSKKGASPDHSKKSKEEGGDGSEEGRWAVKSRELFSLAAARFL